MNFIIHCVSKTITDVFGFNLSKHSTISRIFGRNVNYTCCLRLVRADVSDVQVRFLWSPYGIGQTIIFLPRGFFFILSFFISSPNLSRRRLDVCHTSTHGVVLVRISDAGLKRAARGSLKVQDAKKQPKIAIWAPSHNFVGLYLRK